MRVLTSNYSQPRDRNAFHLALLDAPSQPSAASGKLALKGPSAPVVKAPAPVVAPVSVGAGAGGTAGAAGGWGLFATGLAAGAGALFGFHIPDMWNALFNQRKSITIDGNKCTVKDTAASYLNNLKRDGVDQALKAIPPKTFEWTTPNKYRLQIKQGWGKDGLTYGVVLQDPNGKAQTLGPFQFNVKGGKLTVFQGPFIVAGQNFGQLKLDLRVDGKGLNEAAMTFTSHGGHVTQLKLKPKPCDLDLTFDRLARINAGSQAQAKHLVENHLAASAKANKGSIKNGLVDLLMVIKPGPDGFFRNHGSDALDVITKPLNHLKKNRVDMEPLEKIQRDYFAAGSNHAERAKLRVAGEKWMQYALSQKINQQEIQAIDLVNPFGINFGLSQIAHAAGPVQPKQSTIRLETRDRITAAWKELVRVAANHGYGLTQLADGRFFAIRGPKAKSLESLMAGLSQEIGVDSKAWKASNESHPFKGVKVPGVSIEPRTFLR